MRSSAVMALAGLLAGASLATAPSAWSFGNPIRTIAAADAAPADQPPCENGESRDDSGACPVVDDNQATRGFTLFSGAAAKPQSTAPAAPTTTGKAVAQVQASHAGEFARCGQECDLSVSFAGTTAELTAASKARLARFADALKGPLARKRFEIGGHSDASAGKAASLARAQAVKAFLVAHGVPGTRLEARGYGAEHLAVPGQPNDPRNRRVEARALN